MCPPASQTISGPSPNCSKKTSCTRATWTTAASSGPSDAELRAVWSELDLETRVWRERADMALPFEVGDAATAVFEGRLWVVGGYKLEYDAELKLYYQRPQNSVWTWDFASGKWSRGRDLPALEDEGRIGYTRGTLHAHEGRLYFSGGANLRVNRRRESNQIYEYVSNTAVLALDPGDLSAWDVLLDLSHFASKWREEEYSVLAVVPAEVSLRKLRVKRDQAGSKFAVKYLNITLLPSGPTTASGRRARRNEEFFRRS